MRNMPATKLPKSLSAMDIVIRTRKDGLQNSRIILEDDAADAFLRSLIEAEKEVIQEVTSKGDHYVSHQREKVATGQIVIPATLREASEKLLKQAGELDQLAAEAEKQRKAAAPRGQELLKVRAMRAGSPQPASQVSSK